MRAIGVLTSGGDSPGMNACVRAVVRAGLKHGVRVYGIERGWTGLLTGQIRELTSRDVSGVVNRGGTFLRTARCLPFLESAGRARAAAAVREAGLDGLVVCGGDGSYTGALRLHQEYGIPVAVTPGTIDNDLAGTDHTIGFDTAVGTAVEACDKIRDTADSHDRIFVVEVMGRRAGFLALETALASGAEVVLLPERPSFGIDACVNRLRSARDQGKTSMLVVVAEGAAKGQVVGEAIDAGIQDARVRVSVLGHMLRGGAPSADDRILATRTGQGAVEALLDCGGDCCFQLGVVANRLVSTAIEEVLATPKHIDESLLDLLETSAGLLPMGQD